MKSHARGQESVSISAIARVCSKGSLFQSFLYAFPQGLALVRSGKAVAQYLQ